MKDTTLFPMIEHTASELVQNVEDGHENPLRGYAVIEQAIKFLTECKNQIKDAAITEAERHGEKTFEDGGYQFQLKNGRTTWEYEGCSTWDSKKAELTAIENELKSSFKAMESGRLVVADQNTGEIELPKCNKSADSLSVKPLKQ